MRMLPFDPIYRYMKANMEPVTIRSGNPYNTKRMCAYWGVDAGAFYRWRRRGELQVMTADQICVNLLGVHPSVVYGEQWWTIPDVRDDNGYRHTYKRFAEAG